MASGAKGRRRAGRMQTWEPESQITLVLLRLTVITGNGEVVEMEKPAACTSTVIWRARTAAPGREATEARETNTSSMAWTRSGMLDDECWWLVMAAEVADGVEAGVVAIRRRVSVTEERLPAIFSKSPRVVFKRLAAWGKEESADLPMDA